jgi:hypothetical protein
MNEKCFDEIVERRIKRIRILLTQKRAEYAPDGQDRLHNFNRAAAMLRIPRSQALVGMLAKHLISILDMTDAITRRDPGIQMIDVKIGNAINYLILLEAMLMEDSLEVSPGLRKGK